MPAHREIDVIFEISNSMSAFSFIAQSFGNPIFNKMLSERKKEKKKSGTGAGRERPFIFHIRQIQIALREIHFNTSLAKKWPNS